ncbi:MAG: glucosyl transferase [Ignavibacterium sp.]|nr:glucosyl transferase [Ignavibacterium sp.]
MKNLLKIFLPLTLLVFVQVSCNTTEPKIEPELLLKLEDVSCSEAWLQLSTNNIQLPATINLLKNNTVAQTFSLSTQDSLLYIDSLLPNQNYSFQVSSILSATGGQVSSNKLAATTLDTTSHNFTWQTFEFGQHSSSTLYDVAIINENDIWAVGEIYMNDSLGNPDPICYNAVHWSGQSWELKRIMFYTFCPQGTGEGSYPAQSVFAIDDQNILISSGSQIAYISNGVQIKKECVPVSVNKIWGTTMNDIFIVGYSGGIAHFNGSRWTMIETGTTISLNDIFGLAGEKNIWITGYNISNGNGVFLKYDGITVEKIYEVAPGLPGWEEARKDQISGAMLGVWSAGIHSNWLATSLGFYKFPQNTYGEGTLDYEIVFPVGFLMDIRGDELNNIFAVGHYKTIFHYNGIRWALLMLDFNSGGILHSVATKNHTVIAVGSNGKAIIIKCN